LSGFAKETTHNTFAFLLYKFRLVISLSFEKNLLELLDTLLAFASGGSFKLKLIIIP